MDNFKNVIEKVFTNNLVNSCIIILISIFIYEIINRILLKKNKSNKELKLSNKNKTYLKVLTSIIRYTFIIITILLVLQVNGVNVSSILAGAGILGIVIGFAVQDALKDIIRGMTILSNSYYSVGDVVQYGSVMGKVISITLSTTKIEDIKTFNIVSIANRNIEQVEKVSDSIDIMIPLSYELPIDKAEMIVSEIVQETLKVDEITKCEYKGVSEFKDSNINYMINIHTNPIIRRPITRQVHCIILRVLEKNHIEIPYNQLDIHQK